MMFLIGEAVNVDFSPIITKLTGAITPETVLTVIGSVLAGAMGFFVARWGARLLVRIFTKAITTGRISL